MHAYLNDICQIQSLECTLCGSANTSSTDACQNSTDQNYVHSLIGVSRNKIKPCTTSCAKQKKITHRHMIIDICGIPMQQFFPFRHRHFITLFNSYLACYALNMSSLSFPCKTVYRSRTRASACKSLLSKKKKKKMKSYFYLSG